MYNETFLSLQISINALYHWYIVYLENVSFIIAVYVFLHHCCLNRNFKLSIKKAFLVCA